MGELHPAPPWQVAHWLNTPAPLTVEALRGRVVLAVAFQMLCPGCVSHALPQALRARSVFDPRDLAVVGLHTVFEHHQVQGTPQALAAFVHEYRIDFPIGIDAPSDDGVPRTMRAYRMQGTPTAILIDRAGVRRLQTFGHLDDLRLGAAIQALIGESGGARAAPVGAPTGGCEAPLPLDRPV